MLNCYGARDSQELPTAMSFHFSPEYLLPCNTWVLLKSYLEPIYNRSIIVHVNCTICTRFRQLTIPRRKLAACVETIKTVTRYRAHRITNVWQEAKATLPLRGQNEIKWMNDDDEWFEILSFRTLDSELRVGVWTRHVWESTGHAIACNMRVMCETD